MNYRNSKQSLVILAALALLSSSAFASVEYVGSPDTPIPLLKTYGVDVPTKSGLKSVLPQGWTLLIHRTAVLPEMMSWKPDDPWTQALEDVATDKDLVMKLDWVSKTVTVTSAKSALAEKNKDTKVVPTAVVEDAALAKHNESPAAVASAPAILQPAGAALAPTATGPVVAAALTPIPTAAPAPVYAITTAPATVPATTPSRPVTPIPVVAPLPQPVLTPAVASALIAPSAIAPAKAAPPLVQASAVATPPAQAAEVQPLNNTKQPIFPTNSAKAQIGGSAKNTLAELTQKFGYLLSWEAPDVIIPGAVTLLGVDIAEDVKLLQKAIGLTQTPISIEIYRTSLVLHVIPRSLHNEPVTIIDGPFNGKVMNSVVSPKVITTPYVAPIRASTVQVASVALVPDVAPVPVIAPKPVLIEKPIPISLTSPSAVAEPPVTLIILKGDSLSNVLKTFFLAQGWYMKWKASTDLQAAYPVSFEAPNTRAAMAMLLPKLGLVADFYNPSKLVVIRSADASTN